MSLAGFGLALSWKNKIFSYWWVQSVFLDFHAYIAAVENINLHWESDYSLKTQNGQYHSDHTLYTQHNFSSMKLVNSLEDCHKKTHFFVIGNSIEKWVLFLPWKKTYHYGYAMFLIPLRVWGTQTPSLLTFPIFAYNNFHLHYIYIYIYIYIYTHTHTHTHTSHKKLQVFIIISSRYEYTVEFYIKFISF